MQWMNRAGIILSRLRRRLLSGGALHPRRRPGREAVIGFCLLVSMILILFIGRIVGIGLSRPLRLKRQIGSPHRAEGIGLTDQARKLRERIAFGLGGRARAAAAIAVSGRKRSILITISHRDDASPSGKPPTRLSYTNQP